MLYAPGHTGRLAWPASWEDRVLVNREYVINGETGGL